jgi:hypothetical protein
VLNLQEINREIRERHDSVMAQVTYSYPWAMLQAEVLNLQEINREIRERHDSVMAQVKTYHGRYSKGQCHEIFCFRFFHESSSHKPLKMTLGFRICSKICREIFASQDAPSVSTTPAANFATYTACVVDTRCR